MGYVTSYNRPWLLVDVETAPIDDVSTYIDRADIKAPSNYKNPEAISNYIDGQVQERIDKAALDIDLARVGATGLWAYDAEAPWAFCGLGDQDEGDGIETFWRSYSEVVTERGGVLCGFNILNFDLPLLMRRSQYLGIDYPRLELNRYRSGPIVDLANILSFQGAKPLRSLSFYARRFKLGVEACGDGADMPAAIAAGDWETVRAHNLADLRCTQALAQRLGYIGAPTGEREDQRLANIDAVPV